MPTYTFSFPASASGKLITVRDAAGVTVDTVAAGTTSGAVSRVTSSPSQGAAVVTSLLHIGSYVAEATDSRVFYSAQALGVLDVPATLAIVPVNRAPRIILPFGDSISYLDVGYLSDSPASLRNPATAYEVDAAKSTGMYAWANFYLGHAFKFIGNAGVPGDTTEQMLARIDAALALPSDIVAVQGGANDFTAGWLAARTITALGTIYQRVLDVGKTLLILPVHSRSSMTTAAGKLYLSTVNRWIVEYARSGASRGVLFADTCSVITSPTTGVPHNTGSPYPTADGTHPNAYGAMLQGQRIAETLRPFAQKPALFAMGGNTDPNNFARNASSLGTGGTVANSATGTPADLWTVGASSGTATAAVSKVARTDGEPGEWTRITIGPANTGTLYAQGSVLFDATGANGVKVGDKIMVAVEVRTSGLTDVSQFQGGALNTGANGAYDLSGAWSLGNGNVPDGTGAFVVEGWVIGAGATFLNVRLLFKAASGVLDIGRNAVWKV